MTCKHLRELYQLCQDNNLTISSSDVVRIACQKCQEVEVCPSMMVSEYDARQSSLASETGLSSGATD